MIAIVDNNSFEIIFSFIHPRSPPCVALSEMLELIAALSNPSILILFFNSLITDSNLSLSTGLIIISEIKYSFISFLF